MDRSSVLRLAIIAIAVLVFMKWGAPALGLFGGHEKPQAVPEEQYVDAPGFAPDTVDPPKQPGTANPPPPEGELCKLDGNRFSVELSSRGAAVKHLWLEGGKYEGMDLSTTPDQERWRSLRTVFRGPEANDQVEYDRFPWKLSPSDGKSCVFTYEDADVRIQKTIATTGRPFELAVDTTVTNLAATPKKHQLTIATHAYRTNKETKGGLGRQSPWATELACAGGKDLVKKSKTDFKSGWFAVPSVDRYSAVNSHYFAQALVPMGEPARCELLAEDWLRPGQAADDDDAATVYHARLVYAPKELAPQSSVTYHDISFFGPKEREVLDAAAGPGEKLKDLLYLGYFTPVARFLVRVLQFFHGLIGNWGISIILMTICLRLALFPLSLKQIRTTVAMRKLKPEVDALNAKFKDDAQAKGLAQMELWRKHNVRPLMGCLPQMASMPVWFALYTTLQTAVELYNIPFLWFPDLSGPDPLFILPFVIGGTNFLQQRLMPMQGDPAQQKMMLYLMPGIFIVMMLFLPSGLGVYMFTNGVLGILQQQAVEWHARRALAAGKKA